VKHQSAPRCWARQLPLLRSARSSAASARDGTTRSRPLRATLKWVARRREHRKPFIRVEEPGLSCLAASSRKPQRFISNARAVTSFSRCPSGTLARRSRPCNGSHAARVHQQTPRSAWPNRAGKSSAITRTSGRNSALTITRVADDAAAITTPRFASPPTASLSPNERRFPSQQSCDRHPTREPPYPKFIDPVAPPSRPERHVVTSMTTLHTAIARALARRLRRCPCCQRSSNARPFVTQEDYASCWIELRRIPIPPISISTVSPGFIQSGGL
jgi:hypothetical protein